MVGGVVVVGVVEEAEEVEGVGVCWVGLEDSSVVALGGGSVASRVGGGTESEEGGGRRRRWR